MKMTKRIGKVHKTCALIGGGIGLLMAVSVAAVVGSPLPVIRLLEADALLPPLWLMGLLWLMGYVLLGMAAGWAWGTRSPVPHGEISLWRGLTLLVVEVAFSFAWYRLSFGSLLLLPAGLCLVIGVATGVACTASWCQAYRSSAILCGGVTLCLFCLLLCHLVVILHN